MNIYTNINELPEMTIYARLRDMDINAKIVLYRSPIMEGEEIIGYRNRVGIESETVTSEQAKAMLAIPMTAAETNAIARYFASRSNAGLVNELKSVTGVQAAAYVVQQITNNVAEATALSQFDAAGTFAAAKPILRNMLVGMYRTVDILKLIARILVAMRDHIWPDLQD